MEMFKAWCNSENLEIKDVTYNDLTAYIKSLQAKNLNPATINIRLRAIEKYYNYLGTGSNPAQGLRVRGTRKKALPEILTPEQLEQVYHIYIKKPSVKFKGNRSRITHSRNIVILSLMIYQGLHAGEIGKLEVNHIDLEKGTIYIPSGGRHNSRIIKLQAMQQIIIQNYIDNTRDQNRGKLFDFKGSAHAVVRWLIRDLKMLTKGKIKNAAQIRASVIMNWLKQYNIRQVQYMIGHNNISSTEQYKIKSIDSLQEQLKKYHPLADVAPKVFRAKAPVEIKRSGSD